MGTDGSRLWFGRVRAMLFGVHARLLVASALLVCCAELSACGGSVSLEDRQRAAAPGGDGGAAVGGAGGAAAAGTGGFTEGGAASGGTGGGFVDPGCPDVSNEPTINECQLLGDGTDCPTGFACVPYVQYPAGSCGSERYGTYCVPAGVGTQGQSCEGQACAAGHICVITGEGAACCKICELTAPNTCPSGLWCQPVDIQPGMGACW